LAPEEVFSVIVDYNSWSTRAAINIFAVSAVCGIIRPMNGLQNVFETLGGLIALVGLACLISLPGIGISYLGWKVSAE
jgi:hypothetical protein